MKKTRGAQEIGRPRLRGCEFMDIVDPPPLLRMREERLDTNGCGWDLFAEDVLVLIRQGLGEVIVPAESANSLPGMVSSFLREEVSHS